MQVTHKIKIQLDDRLMIPPIDVMQGDANTRKLEIALYAGGKEWVVPDGVSVAVAYRGESGHGAYDTLPDGSKAYIVAGNVVTVTLIPQVTARDGKTTVTVVFTDNAGRQIATFGVLIRVAFNPLAGAGEPANYYNLREWASTPLCVELLQGSDGNWSADESFSAIQKAFMTGRQILCEIETNDQQRRKLALVEVREAALVFGAVVGGTEWTAEISRGDDGAAVSAVTNSSLNKPTLCVHLEGNDPKALKSSVPFADIVAAHQSGRAVAVRLQSYSIPLVTVEADYIVFQCTVGSAYVYVGIWDDDYVTFSSDYCALQSDLEKKADKPSATDEKYFDITQNGVISLKKEYRGASPATSSAMAASISDNGNGLAGSKNRSLPEEIIIPASVNGVAVTGYAQGMFYHNSRLRKLTLLGTVTAIPTGFCGNCINLQEVAGTEAVRSLGAQAFTCTAIAEARFPNLTALDTASGSQFLLCANLVTADLGNTITEIPVACFSACEKLSRLEGCAKVTALGVQALYFTKCLKELPFRDQLTRIDAQALYLSRANTEGFIPDPGGNYTACHTRMYSTFEQHDPRWAWKYILNYRNGDQYAIRKYTVGCIYVCAAMIYSALEKKTLHTPEEFIQALFEACPELAHEDAGADATLACLEHLAEGMAQTWGYTWTLHKAVDAESVQAVYDELAASTKDKGVLVMARIVGDYVGTNHTVVIHGVNEDGEVMVVDPAATSQAINIYEAATYAMPVRNLCRATDFLLVMRK